MERRNRTAGILPRGPAKGADDRPPKLPAAFGSGRALASVTARLQIEEIALARNELDIAMTIIARTGYKLAEAIANDKLAALARSTNLSARSS